MRTRTGLMISMALLVLLPPALALAGGGGGGEGGHAGAHGASLKEHGYYLINFLVFIGLLYVLAGDPLKPAIRARSRSVGEAIVAAEGVALAKERSDAAARLQAERDRLERSREAILPDLDRSSRELAEQLVTKLNIEG